jgi:glucose/arabinose dehydrogenase
MRVTHAVFRLAGVCALLSIVTGDAGAQQLVAQPFATGLSFPVAFLGDPTANNRHFVVEQTGHIRILIDGVVQTTPFLDLSGAISNGPERGLLGMAVDPEYATNRRFYAFFTRAEDPGTACPVPGAVGCEVGDLVVARFRRSAGNPLVADAGSRFDLRWISTGLNYIEHSQFSNHNGGTLMFGPDGYLYIGVGDGGASYDPYNSGQSPNSLLGKMLRIDVDVMDGDTNGYQIPPDNPFVDDAPIDAFEEIWAFGLRNPWKFSFDDPSVGGTGALIIADVGQNRWEEINFQPAGQGGRNYGWRIREASHPEVNAPATTPAWGTLADLTNPVYEYSHVTGETPLQGRSITGGFVYRGSDLNAVWRGRYFFGDFASRRIWSATVAPGTGAFSGIIDHSGSLGPITVSSFGVDPTGKLYIVQYGAANQGVVHRLCDVTVTRGVVGFWNTGGTGTLRVDTQPGCNWSLSIDAPWIVSLSGLSGSGSATIVFRVAPNAGPVRSGNITIAGSPVNVVQSNAPPVHGDLDFNTTGDLLWQHTDGRLAVWYMIHATLIDGRPLGPGALADPDWRIAASGDFDRDGSRDVVFQHQTDGRLALWLMSGAFLLSGDSLNPGQVPDVDWKIRAAADMDRDGWLDLIWQHQGNGSVAVWLMTGARLRDGRLMTPGVVSDTAWRIVGAGDLNGDGHADLLWQHQTNGLISAWLMNGTSLVSGVLLSPGQVADTQWKIRAVADINGDRRLDLVWQNQSTGLLSIWLMDGTARMGDGLRLNPAGVSDTNWQIVGPR